MGVMNPGANSVPPCSLRRAASDDAQPFSRSVEQ